MTMLDGIETRKVVREDGTKIAYSVVGHGPLILLVHGFPESWYSYRHIIPPLAEAGYQVAAIHVRGYGESDKPSEVEAYLSRTNADDIVAVIDDLGHERAVLVGHDWGSVLVQTAAILHPDRLSGLVTLSVPVFEPLPAPASEVTAQIFPDNMFYQHYFNVPGQAEREIDADPERFLRIFFHYMSGQHPVDENILVRPKGSTALMEGLTAPESLPAWLTADDLAYYLKSFAEGGFTGPLNRYRAWDLDFPDLIGTEDLRVTAPTLFIGGDLDPSRWIYGVDSYADPLSRCDDPRGLHMVAGVGHWIQQEAPHDVVVHMLTFLSDLREENRL